VQSTGNSIRPESSTSFFSPPFPLIFERVLPVVIRAGPSAPDVCRERAVPGEFCLWQPELRRLGGKIPSTWVEHPLYAWFGRSGGVRVEGRRFDDSIPNYGGVQVYKRCEVRVAKCYLDEPLPPRAFCCTHVQSKPVPSTSAALPPLEESAWGMGRLGGVHPPRNLCKGCMMVEWDVSHSKCLGWFCPDLWPSVSRRSGRYISRHERWDSTPKRSGVRTPEYRTR